MTNKAEGQGKGSAAEGKGFEECQEACLHSSSAESF